MPATGQLVDTLHHDVYPAIDPNGALRGAVKGQAVLITGAGRGIGQATALAFANGGASVIALTARSGHELEATKEQILKAQPNVKVICQKVDVTSEESVSALFEHLDKEGVKLDVLVNNAGYLEPNLLIHEGKPEDWWRSWEVNVKGTYLPTHFLLKRHVETPRPLTIINTSSVGAISTRPGFSGYQPSKTAVNRFTEFIHAEYADKGVRTFAMHPGGVMTALAGNMPASTHSILQDKPELAAGFHLWLAAEQNKKLLEPWQGTYLSCNWDVDEFAEVKPHDGGQWGKGTYGTTRPNW